MCRKIFPTHIHISYLYEIHIFVYICAIILYYYSAKIQGRGENPISKSGEANSKGGAQGRGGKHPCSWSPLK